MVFLLRKGRMALSSSHVYFAGAVGSPLTSALISPAADELGIAALNDQLGHQVVGNTAKEGNTLCRTQRKSRI